jgi:hypothetical protein
MMGFYKWKFATESTERFKKDSVLSVDSVVRNYDSPLILFLIQRQTKA